MTTRISKLTSWLVGILAGIAFILSYNALQAVADSNGIEGWRSSIWPLLIDASLVVFSLAVVRNALRGEQTAWPWFLVGLYTLATIVFNLVHAPSTWTAWAVAVVAPVSLFLSFETLMSQFYSEVKRSAVVQSLADLSAEVSKVQAKRDSLAGQVDRLTVKRNTLKDEIKETKRANVTDMNQARQIKIDQRRQTVGQMLQAGQTEQDIATAVDVSLKTIKRDIAAIEMSANGQNQNGAGQ
jgi:uncharacterized protein YerC